MIQGGGAGLVRAARLVVFAISATVLALGAHLAAGGAPPGAVPTLAAIALPGLAGHVLARRRRGWLAIAVVLGAVQLVLHEIFVAAAGAGQAGHAGHAGASGTAMTAGMTAAHLLAVLCTALLLARGERVLHLLAEWLSPLPVLPARPGPLLPPARPAPAAAAGDPLVEPPSLRAGAPVVRRGPPLPCW